MLRTRLGWFSLGFSASAAAISQFVWRDLLVDRYALSSDMKQKFDALEHRILNLESIPYQNSNSAEVQNVRTYTTTVVLAASQSSVVEG